MFIADAHCDTLFKMAITDERQRAVSKDTLSAGGVGVQTFALFAGRNGPNGAADIEDVVRHIDTLCEMGAEQIVGFGSDFDGIESWPEGLEDPSRFPAVLEALRKRGYSEKQLENIAGMNLWRLLKQAENA